MSNKPLTVFISLEEYLAEDPQLGLTDYLCSDSKIVNLLLVGRSPQDNIIFLESLINPRQAANICSFSAINGTEIRTFIVKEAKNSFSYTINAVYLPMLHKSLNEEELFAMIRSCIMQKISCINAVLYVSIAGQTHELDIEIFKTIEKFLGKSFSSNSLLILNHIGDLSNHRLEQLISDMKVFNETRTFIEYCSLGIFPYITMNAESLNDDEDDDDNDKNISLKTKCIRKCLLKIETLRQNLLQTIIKTAENSRIILDVAGFEMFTKKELKQATDDALIAEKQKWEKQLDENIKQYNERFMQMHEDKTNIFDNKIQNIQQENNRRNLHLQEQFKQKLNHIQAEFQKKLEEERKLQRSVYEHQLSILKIEGDQREKARLYAERVEKEEKDRKEKYKAELQKCSLEEEELLRQQQRADEEKYHRELIETQNESLRKILNEQKRIREEVERRRKDNKCSIS